MKNLEKEYKDFLISSVIKNVKGLFRLDEEIAFYTFNRLINEQLIKVEENLELLFKESCLAGNIQILKLLLSNYNADPTASDNYAIRWAAINRKVEVVKLLLEDGRADPTSNDNDAIIMAAKHGYAEIVKLLLKDGRVDTSENV